MHKVCHITSAHRSYDYRIFHKECTSLAKAGFDTYLVARGESGEVNGVHVVGVGEISNSRLKRMLFGAKRVYEAALKIDANLYHFHDPELIPYGIKLKKKGKIVIFDSHENTDVQIFEKKWIPGFLRPAIAFLYKHYQDNACRKFDSVLGVSTSTYEQYKKLNANAEMITNYPVIPSGEFIHPEMKDRKIVFAGNVSDLWNNRNVILAIEKLRDVTFEMCGFIPWGDKTGTEYFNSLKELDGWKKVNFLGRIPHEDVKTLLSQCNIGISVMAYRPHSSSNVGTLGITKMFEYMMAGLPIICNDLILWKEIIDKYQCGITVDPENIGEIADAIAYLLDNPNQAKEMGLNGRKAVEEAYNWGIEEKKLVALYHKLLKAG